MGLNLSGLRERLIPGHVPVSMEELPFDLNEAIRAVSPRVTREGYSLENQLLNALGKLKQQINPETLSPQDRRDLENQRRVAHALVMINKNYLESLGVNFRDDSS